MSTKIIQGNPIAPGYAVGPLHVPKGESFEKPVASGANDPSLEFDRFLQRLQVLEQEIEETVNKCMCHSKPAAICRCCVPD